MNISKTIPNFENLSYRFVSIKTKNKMQKTGLLYLQNCGNGELSKIIQNVEFFSKNSLPMHIRQKCLGTKCVFFFTFYILC